MAIKKNKQIDKMCNRVKRLKGKYFKARETLNGMWDDLFELHEELSKLKGEKNK